MEPLAEALRSFFAPLIKVTNKWPPLLAYGVPVIVAIVVIVAINQNLPPVFFWMATILILAPVVAYIYQDARARSVTTNFPSRLWIRGNVYDKNGMRIKGACVIVDGVDLRRETDENGWYEIEVDNQDCWTVRSWIPSNPEEVARVEVDRKNIANPVILTLNNSPSNKAVLSPVEEKELEIVYKATVLDGHSQVTINEITFFEEGCKFRLILRNSGHQTITIDTLGFKMDHKPIDRLVETLIDAGAMRFGQARNPHQLFLDLKGNHWDGHWVIYIDDKAEQRFIPTNCSNLLEVDPPIAFELEPTASELIYGAVTSSEPGYYSFSFHFEYSSLTSIDQVMETQTLSIIKVK